MFKVQLYQNKSPTNMVSKTLDSIAITNGTLRKGCSITDPVLQIFTDGNERWRYDFNYMYIEPFKRYYFVTNVIAVEGTDDSTTEISPMQIWEVHAHVDVLMSFKDQILKQKAVVARQTNTYNLMLDDGFFMAYSNPKIQTKVFSVPDPFETQEFVLIVAGS